MSRTINLLNHRLGSQRVASILAPIVALLTVQTLGFAQEEPPVDAPQAEPPPTESPAPVADPPPAPEAPVAETPVDPAPAIALQAPAEPVAVEVAEPVAEEPDPINMGVWGRVDVTLQNPEDPEKLDDIGSSGTVELHLSGQLTEAVGWTANLVAGYGGGTISGTAGLLDLIAQFQAHESFNIWAGRMLVASDRSNFSGVWFMSPWNYPGLYVAGAPPVGPRQGPNGRNDGLTVWGNILDGHIKYYAGAYNLHDATTSPLFSGRLNISLINPEAGYYSNSTYYGGKDLLALGVGFQSQNDGSVGLDGMDVVTDDYSLINADLLFEKNFGADVGTLDLEAAVYAFSGDYEPVDLHYFGVASYLLPMQVGPGKLQPLFRLQQANTQGTDETWRIIEGYLGYVVKDFSLRGSLGFVNTTLGGAGADGEDLTSNALMLGVQFMQ